MAQGKPPHPEEAAQAAVSKDALQPIQRPREYFPLPRYPISEPDSHGTRPGMTTRDSMCDRRPLYSAFLSAAIA